MRWKRALPRAAGELGVFALYILVAIALTWPLAKNLSTTVADLGDPLLNAWILDWDLYALTHAPLHIFDAPIFYPAKYPLAFSENLIGVAILCLPFYLLGLSPLTIYNLALLLGFALSAYAGYVAARVVTRDRTASLIAGLLYGFVSHKFAHLSHLQIIWSAGPAFLLAAILVYRRTPTWWNAALVSGALVMSALTNMYYFLFSAVALALTLVLIAIYERRPPRFWLTLAAAIAAGALILTPILLPYHAVSKEYRMKRGAGETLGGSATPGDWLIASRRSFAYGDATGENKRLPERELFPGLMLLLLALVPLLMTPRVAQTLLSVPAQTRVSVPHRLKWLDAMIVLLTVITYFGVITDGIRIEVRGHVILAFSTATIAALLLTICIIVRLSIRFPKAMGTGNLRSALQGSRFPFEMWVAALWIVLGFVGSLGLNTFFHQFLFHRVPGFRAMRVPTRWAMIAYTGLAVWAAAGVVALSRGRRWRVAAIAAFALLDIWTVVDWEHALVETAPVDRWIGEQRAGPLLLLPANKFDALYQYELRATAHHQPIFNGMSGFEPPLHRILREGPLDDRSMDLLERNGCRFIVLRPDWAASEAPLTYKWLQHQLDAGRLAFIRKFEYSLNGDWIFAVTRVERDWQRYRVPAVRDGAGLTADQELTRLLNNEQVYSGTTFGQLHQPKIFDDIRGPMTVSGFALSPYGVRSVTVRVHNGSYRFPAGLFELKDVTRRLPWYPQAPKPGFAVKIPRPPRGLNGKTDLQIEIVDGRGVTTLLPDVVLTWRR